MEDGIRVLIGGQRGPEAVVVIDYEDAILFKTYTCYPHRTPHTSYVMCYPKGVNPRPRRRALHNIIMEPPVGKVVDHISGNGLDNRRCNMRVVDQRQNLWNSIRKSQSRSPYKGVTLLTSGRWAARIRDFRTEHYVTLGTYETAEEAARAYDAKAIELRGEYAKLNFPRTV
jgi:hypothetical protein